MQRWLNIITKILELVRLLFGKKQQVADTSPQNVEKISTGLKMAPQTKEVAAARRTIEEIQEMSPEEQVKRAEDVRKAQEIVEQKVAAKPVLTDGQKRLSMLEKIREEEKRQGQ